jgi:YjbE family integral membrane protein
MPVGVTPSGLVGWLVTAGGIILVDLALSGDNALIIGAAASRLPRRQQLVALLWGGAGAIILRILLTTIASQLLLVPLVQTAGAVVILFITIRMLIPEADDGEADQRDRRAADRLGPAILTILVADFSMSLDNVLAIGALSHGNVVLLVFGLLLSMVLLLTASAVVARLIQRFPWLMDLTALVLAYTAATLALSDKTVSAALGLTGGRTLEVIVGTLLFTLLVDIALRVDRAWHVRRGQRAQAETAAERAPAGGLGAASADAEDADRAAATQATQATRATRATRATSQHAAGE